MKKLIAVTTVFLSFIVSANAQFRKMTDAEMAFLNSSHKAMYASLPTAYQDWTSQFNGTNFDAQYYWCAEKEAKCVGLCPVSMGKGDPWGLDVSVEFKMPQSQSAGLMMPAYKQIKDFNNATQIATALKSMAKTKLTISIFSNVSSGQIGAFLVSSCSKTPAVKLTIPVPTTLALMGIHSVDCPFMDGSRPDMAGDNYYDNAVVFLGKPVSGQYQDDRHDGQTRVRYAIGFDKTKINSLIVQNIVVKFSGDAEDIKAAIKLMDWEKLSALIAK